MTELSSTLKQESGLIEKTERTPENIQAGQDKIQREFEEYKRLYNEHIKTEEEERDGLDDAMDRSLAEAKDYLYNFVGANKNGNHLERFNAGVIDGLMEKGEVANEIKKDPLGVASKIKEGISHIFSSIENFAHFVEGINQSVINILTDTYHFGKGTVDFLFGFGGGKLGVNVFKKGKELTKKIPVTTGVLGVPLANESGAIVIGKLAKESVGKALTRAEKLAMKPDGIEAKRWDNLTKKYKKLTPTQLEKVFKTENFLIKNGIEKEYLKKAIKSMDINSVRIIKSSPKDIIVYRFYGKGSDQFSYYYGIRDLRFIPKHEIKDFLALPDNNSIERVSQVIIPRGSPMIMGKITKQKVDGVIFLTEKLGGSHQIYYPLKDKNVRILSDYNLKELQNGN